MTTLSIDTPETQEAIERWRRGNINIFDEMARLERERDEARAERDILRLDAQREAEHHDRLVKELEGQYDQNAKLIDKLDQLYRDIELDQLKEGGK
jgi:predicted RNase H-like nuclease (RuvC/YqgF family)